MTKISFHHNSNGEIIRVEARGHSGDAPEGESIVCAGISTVFEILLAGAEDFPEKAISFIEKNEEAWKKIHIKPEHLNWKQWIEYTRMLEAARNVLEKMADNYPQFCSIK